MVPCQKLLQKGFDGHHASRRCFDSAVTCRGIGLADALRNLSLPWQAWSMAWWFSNTTHLPAVIDSTLGVATRCAWLDRRGSRQNAHAVLEPSRALAKVIDMHHHSEPFFANENLALANKKRQEKIPLVIF